MNTINHYSHSAMSSRKPWFSALLLLCMSLFVSGCTSINGPHHSELKPTIDFREFFTGEVNAWGLVQNRSGEVIRRFKMDLVGTWENDTGTLEEEFYYLDGEREQRVWTITDLGNGQYRATADDIIGEAIGQEYGNAIGWDYKLQIPIKDKTMVFDLDDWMWALDGDVLINRSYIKKFGIRVAEISIFLMRAEPTEETK